MTVDNVTPEREYPLPDPTNILSEDVLRLIAAVGSIDSDVASILAALATKAAVSHMHAMGDISGLESALAGKVDAGTVYSLAGLSDTDVAAAAANMFFKLVGGKWVGANITAADISSGTIAQARLPSHLAPALVAALEGTSIKIPAGTSAQRPAAPNGPRIRYNTELLSFETWDGANWATFGEVTEIFDPFLYNATGGETVVSVPGGYVPNVGLVFRNGILLRPGAVTITSGTNIVFSTALSAADEIYMLRFRSFSVAGILAGDIDVEPSILGADDVQGALAALVTALNGKQATLSYAPVQQGTGVGQNPGNNIKIGWKTGDKLGLTVDLVDLGNIALEGWVTATFAAISHTHTIANITGLQAALDAKATSAALSSGLAGKLNTSALDSIANVGLASNDPNAPYMRQSSTNNILYLQRALGFTPVRQGTANILTFFWNGSEVAVNVDATGMGAIALQNWVNANFATLTQVNTGWVSQQSADAVGSYRYSTTAGPSITFGGGIAGSSLNGTPPGTWRCMSHPSANGSTAGIFVRVA